MSFKPIKIGTRGSPMALAQTNLVRERLAAARPDLGRDAFEIVTISTIADRVLDRPLSEIGGKGLFTKEIEAFLLDGRIDLAVHSMKDVETWMPEELEIACILPRDDPRDAFLSPRFNSLMDLPAGSRIGTSSLRRKAQLLMLRPDIAIVPLRGNANTRLRKLEEGACEATLLALCGMERLGLQHLVREVLSIEDMLPSASQGALGVQMRKGDQRMADLIAPLACPETTLRLTAERALLDTLDGSCETPIAALATIEASTLTLSGLLLEEDGSRHWSGVWSGPAAEAARIGAEGGRELRRMQAAD